MEKKFHREFEALSKQTKDFEKEIMDDLNSLWVNKMGTNPYKLSDIAEIISGGTPRTSIPEYWDGNIPWLSVNDFSGDSRWVNETEKHITELGVAKSATKVLSKGDLIISARGTVGELAELSSPMAFNQSCFGLRGKNGTRTDYLYYLLKYNMPRLKVVANGATFGTIILDTFDRVKVDVHNIKDQKKIASFLSAYDSLIENNQKRIKILEQMAEDLYKEWFVRFRFPGYENEEFEGGIPKGWKIEKLKQFITFYRGKSYNSEDIASGDYVLLSMNNIKPWGGYIRDDSRVYGGPFKDFQLLHKGDIIMSITDMTQDRRIIGYVGIFDEDRNDCIMSTHLMKIVSNYNNYYLYGLFNFSLSRSISECATGANVLGLTDKILKEIKALVPTYNLIFAYGKVVKPLWEEIFHIKDEIANLTKQRDLLLPRLMTGKLSL